jgi:hypothetical protein
MALRMVRSECRRGRPTGDSGGKSGSKSVHSASVRSEAERRCGVSIPQHSRCRCPPDMGLQTVSDTNFVWDVVVWRREKSRKIRASIPYTTTTEAVLVLPEARCALTLGGELARLCRWHPLGLTSPGGIVTTIINEVPQWFLDGHRQPPTGRSPGRPTGATDSYKRAPYRLKKNLPATT